MNDPEFDDLLRKAKGDSPLPNSFRQGVWRRIELASPEASGGLAWLRMVTAALIRPWGAAAGLAATVVAGVWLGSATVPEAKDARAAYAESISPFLQFQRK